MLVNKCIEEKGYQSPQASNPVTPDTLTSGSTTPEPLDLESDVSEGGATQTDRELLASQLSISNHFSTEDELDRARDGDGQREEMRQGSKESDQGDKKPWDVEKELDGGRAEEEKTDEEELDEDMKTNLYRLIAQSRLAYFSSTEDELHRGAQSEEEWEGENEEWREGKTEALTYKLCQLEKEVRANQFSSTEDELDRVGISGGERRTEEEDEGKKEELAVKLCRLADQVNAAQFSSTEDELDGAGRGEGEEDGGRSEEAEEAVDEETLWKLQADKAVQAAQVRDLASLVSACQFSSTEDELDRVGENEGEQEIEVDEGGIDCSVKLQELWFVKIGRQEEEEGMKNPERRGSIDDFDVEMFDLKDKFEEREKATDAGEEGTETRREEKVRASTAENLMKSQAKVDNIQQDKTEVEEPEEKDHMEGKEEEEDEKMTEDLLGQTEAFKEALIGREKEAEERHQRERTEDRSEEGTETGEGENRPEVKWSDREGGGERGEEENIRGSKEQWWKWETAAGSDEEGIEFDRIISSMLMMSLDEMKADTFNQPEKNKGGNRERGKVEADEEKVLDTRNTNASEEAEEFGSRDNNVISESAQSGGNGTEPVGGNIYRNQEIGDVTIGNKQQRKETDPQERKDLGEKETTDSTIKKAPEETDEAEQTIKRVDMEGEEQEERGGQMEMEQQRTERQGGATGEREEEDYKRKNIDETLQETKEREADDMEQSVRCPQEGLLSPEEIQNVSTAPHHTTQQIHSETL